MDRRSEGYRIWRLITVIYLSSVELCFVTNVRRPVCHILVFRILTGVYHVLTCIRVVADFLWKRECFFSCHPDPVSSARLISAGEDERDISALRSVRSEL